MSDRLGTFRSALFVPATDLAKAEKAFASSADAVILDLEDAVIPDRKGHARECVRAFRAPSSALLMVRINGATTQWFEQDLAAVAECHADAIVLPKADSVAVARLSDSGPPVLALVETATGLRDAVVIAEHPRVFALFLGGVDLAADLWWEPRADGLELLFARSTVVMASAAAGLRPPMDVVHMNVRDLDSLAEEARLSRSLGFGAKACIHPGQVETVNAAFRPSPEQCAKALAIMTAFAEAQAQGSGVVLVEGKLVDLPVVRWAERVLAQAEAFR